MNTPRRSIVTEIPRHLRVRIKIRYNSYVHDRIGLVLEEDHPGQSCIAIVHDEMPPGYYAEHGCGQIDYSFDTRCLIPDQSGEHGWIATEEVDLDCFAGGGEESAEP